jgi:hypothetical protein
LAEALKSNLGFDHGPEGELAVATPNPQNGVSFVLHSNPHPYRVPYIYQVLPTWTMVPSCRSSPDILTGPRVVADEAGTA